MNCISYKVKILINDNENWIDVSNKSAIIYGAGQGCFEMLHTLQLFNIKMVIDGDTRIQKKHIMIQNRLFQISAPQELNKLKADYYIIVSSIKYQESIKKEIKSLVGFKFPVCVWDKGFRYEYRRMEDLMLLDPFVKKKLLQFNLSLYVYHIIDTFIFIKKKIFKHQIIDRFISINHGGSKLIFFFGNRKHLWVFSYRGIESSWDTRLQIKNENRLFKQRILYLKKLNIDSKITLYRDGYGVLVQKYANTNLDFNSVKIRKAVMLKCRDLHTKAISDIGNIQFIDSFYLHTKKNFILRDHYLKDVFDKMFDIGEKSRIVIESNSESSVLHGDLTYENIVLFNGDIYFIDWEFMSIGNPMIDVCYFLFSIHRNLYLTFKESFQKMCTACYTELAQLLSFYYYDRFSFSNELKTAFAIMDIYLIKFVLENYIGNSNATENDINIFLNLHAKMQKSHEC